MTNLPNGKVVFNYAVILLKIDTKTDDPKKVGSFTSDSDSVKEIQVSVTKYTVWEEEKEDRRVNDGIQASQNSTAKKEIFKVLKGSNQVSTGPLESI